MQIAPRISLCSNDKDMDEDEASKIILEHSRFWVQKVFVPMMVCIGVVGNTITVMVLTRRRMRNSTHTYLSALAIADIIHLLFVFLLSFKHYNHIHDRRYELYWRFYGITHWLCDAGSSTSVWLTVSFTIERYIAVCHPMKGRAVCTESRAKTVIVIVYIFCLITTAGTTFEYQLTINNTCPCKPGQNQTDTSQENSLQSDAQTHPSNELRSTLNKLVENCTNHPHIIYVYPQVVNTSYTSAVVVDDAKLLRLSRTQEGHVENTLEHPPTMMSHTPDDVQDNQTCCEIYRVGVEYTDLGNNYTYTTFVSWYSAIFFGLFPLALIATFNCFLVRAVYLSQRKRKAMTNTQENMSISNENRITLMLIGVVVMFLICQLPTAVFLIYNDLYASIDNAKKRNINLILGNFFNLLITVNGSCNFVLYSLMSKKFRSTFKQIFCDRVKKRHDTMLLSSIKSVNSQKFDPKKQPLMRRNISEYRNPRNLEAQSLTAMPRSKSLMVRSPVKAGSDV